MLEALKYSGYYLGFLLNLFAFLSKSEHGNNWLLNGNIFSYN